MRTYRLLANISFVRKAVFKEVSLRGAKEEKETKLKKTMYKLDKFLKLLMLKEKIVKKF